VQLTCVPLSIDLVDEIEPIFILSLECFIELTRHWRLDTILMRLYVNQFVWRDTFGDVF
jgi:hypothetical protein